jgi:hypothetical protein
MVRKPNSCCQTAGEWMFLTEKIASSCLFVALVREVQVWSLTRRHLLPGINFSN